MGAIFFEGFNHNNSDVKKLDSSYWTPSNPSSISFGQARTGNGIYIANTPLASGVSSYNNLSLTGFTDPMTYGSMGLGFYVDTIKTSNQNTSETPTAVPQPLVTLKSQNNTVAEIKISRVPNDGGSSNIALSIFQGEQEVGVYKFSDVLGYTYTLFNSSIYYSEYNIFDNISYLNRGIYLEFYISHSSIGIRVDGLDMINLSTGNFLTSLASPITALNQVVLYGSHAMNGSFPNTIYDDFYISQGSVVSNTLLGSNTKIFRLTPESNGSIVDWNNTTDDIYYGVGSNTRFFSSSDISSNDGDNSYVYTADTNDIALYNMSNIPSSVTEAFSVGGMKILNTARKVTQDSSFVNIYSSDGSNLIQFDNTYSLNSTIYSYFNIFSFTNPETVEPWTIAEINNMQLGIKKLDPAPTGTILYFNGAVDSDWTTVSNWWLDDEHTEPAGRLPTSADSVVATANITASGQTVVDFTITGSVGLDGSLTVTGMATFNDTSFYVSGTITGNATFNNSGNNGTVTGTATFTGSAYNCGTAGTFVPDPPPGC